MNSFLVLFVIAAVYFSNVNSEEKTPIVNRTTTEIPTSCKVEGLPIDKDTLTETKSFWWIGRKLVIEIVAPFDVPSCTPPTIRDLCGGMKVEINRNKDGSRVFKIAARDMEYNDVSCSEVSYPLIGEKKSLEFSGELLSFGSIGVDNRLEIAPDAPEKYYTPARGKVAIISIAQNNEWFMMEDCEKRALWVLYSEAVVQANQINNFNSDVETAVKDAGFDVGKLVPVETSIQSDVSACIAAQ